MSDLDQFKDTYITEAFELIDEMEEKLLDLDPAENDLEEINAIFRCAHSIKGGAGSFGFTRLVEFTHILEFLLDALRNQQIDISDEIIDALLRSVDIVSALISAAQTGSELQEGYEDSLKDELTKLSEQKKLSSESSSQDSQLEDSQDKSTSAEESEAYGLFGDDEDSAESGQEVVNRYRIKFTPYDDLFSSGNEPLFIIRELSRVSEIINIETNTSNIPDISKIEPFSCYMSWDIEVESPKDLDVIEEVFEFVEDECDLKIEKISTTKDEASISEDDSDGAYGLFLDNNNGSDKTSPESQDDPDGAFGLFIDDGDNNDLSASKPNVAVKDTSEPSKVQASSPSLASSASKKQVSSPAVTSIRVDLSKIDRMVNMVGELVITQAMIMQKMQDIPTEHLEKVSGGVSELSRHTRELQEAVMSVRMQPVKSVFSRMPRIVRDLSKKLNKKVRIETQGETTEIDKTVIEQLTDQLTHMIRNSVDHGIEMPNVRLENNKPEEGTIKLSADSSGGRIIIEISDDGGGVNREKVLQKAIEKKVVLPDANLSDEEIDNLIFAAGFSTADAVTDVSGRGVGMDVVRKNIKNLGGDIEMINEPGKGSTFLISLPLTLAILDGMVVRIGNEKYIIPINNILETMQIEKDDIMSVKTGDEVIKVRGEFIPISYLAKIFNIDNGFSKNEKELIVLVETSRQKMGIVVDELIGQQQVVIKNLEENSDPVRGISGATILGDGNVSLILDVAQIQRMRGKNNNGKTINKKDIEMLSKSSEDSNEDEDTNTEENTKVA